MREPGEPARRDTIDRNTDSPILFLRGITMVDCPQCGKKVPDNMKFCGFCGIELATGKEATTERWFSYFETNTMYNLQLMSNAERRVIAFATLALTSMGVFLANLSFSSPIQIVLAFLGLIGMAVGFSSISSNLKSHEMADAINLVYQSAHKQGLMGRLSTSTEFLHYIDTLQGRFNPDLRNRLRQEGIFQREIFSPRE